ncbi:hypothetical protein HY992_04160 [Candidatus Micrarchaeota archaeon]|nr:hypothetical protein [Candidatus Micrarchaeota archaeon]
MEEKYARLLKYVAFARRQGESREARECDDCGSNSIQREGRCLTCRQCGWSACG